MPHYSFCYLSIESNESPCYMVIEGFNGYLALCEWILHIASYWHG